MKIKHLILATAASFVAAGTAQAADLPMVEPVDYVKVCDAYGAGYFFIPGTDTCLKINGEVEFKVHKNGFRNGYEREDGLYDFDTSMNVTFTAREETEMGTLTAVIEIDDEAETTGGNGAAIDKAYLQLGGFYAGITDSLIEFNGGQAYDDFDTSHGDLNAIGYKMALGNGVTAGIALEEYDIRPTTTTTTTTWVDTFVDIDGDGILDQVDMNGDGVWDTVPIVDSSTSRAGRSMPAVAASIAVDQAWGTLAFGASAYQVRYANAAFTTDIGYTFGADAAIDLMEGLTFTFGGGYSMGGRAPDGAAGASAGILNSQWEVSAGLAYALADNLEVALGGGYRVFDDRVRANGAAANDDQTIWGVSAAATYTPVKNLDIGGKIGYQKVDFRSTSTNNDWDDIAAELTITRSF